MRVSKASHVATTLRPHTVVHMAPGEAGGGRPSHLLLVRPRAHLHVRGRSSGLSGAELPALFPAGSAGPPTQSGALPAAGSVAPLSTCRSKLLSPGDPRACFLLLGLLILTCKDLQE